MPPRTLPLNAVHAFIVTARHLNLTRAARELCITQGAVSRKIAALENWLGFALFVRHARGLHLTTRGAALLPAFKNGLEQMTEAAEQAVNAPRTVRLKAPTCAMRWLVPKLVALEKAQPAIHVSLTTTVDHSTRLEHFDAAILYGTLPPGGHLLFDEVLTPVMAPDPTVGDRFSLQDLARYTFLHPTADGRDWLLWLNAQEAPVPQVRNQHFDTMDLAIGAALQGFGVTVADLTLTREERATGRLIAPFRATVKTGAVYSLIQRPVGEAPPHLADVVAWLLQN